MKRLVVRRRNRARMGHFLPPVQEAAKFPNHREGAPMRIDFSKLLFSATLSLAVISGTAFAQLGPNQTAGFGAGKVLTITYSQSFDCVDVPTFDLNFNGI